MARGFRVLRLTASCCYSIVIGAKEGYRLSSGAREIDSDPNIVPQAAMAFGVSFAEQAYHVWECNLRLTTSSPREAGQARRRPQPVNPGKAAENHGFAPTVGASRAEEHRVYLPPTHIFRRGRTNHDL